MSIPLRVLILEDRAADAELMAQELQRAGYALAWQRVDTERDYVAQLAVPPDLILADYSLPQFDALTGLRLVLERGLDIPFIIVSGSVSEEAAAECMRRGASDYLLKDRLARLGQAVTRALEQKHLRDAQRQAAEERERLLDTLGKRVKELTALHRTARILQKEDPSTAKLLQEIVSILPTAWKYPEVAAARVGYGETECSTANFSCSPWMQTGVFTTADGETGRVDIAYLEERPPEAEGPFLAEERYLIDSLADMLRVHFERKRAEGELRLQGAALEAAASAVVITDREGHITWANPAFSRLTGYTVGEALGQNPRLLKSGVHDPAFYRDLWDTILSGRVWRGELVNRRKDESLYIEEQTITPVPDASGGVRYFIAIKQDITQRERALEALRQSEQKLALHVQQTPLAVIEWDTETRVVKWNPGAERVFGYTQAEALGQRAADLIVPPSAREHAGRVWRDLLAHRGGERSTEENNTKDGRRIQCEWYNTPLVTATGSVIGVASLVLDVTERKQAEEALVARTGQLETIRAVTVEITHELDLNVLLGLIHRYAAKLVGASAGVIWLWDDQAQLLIPRAWRGLEDLIGTLRYRLGEGVAGTVAQRRVGLLVNEYPTSPYAQAPVVERTRIRAILAEPLLYRGQLLGVLELLNELPREGFTEEDRQLLGLFAAQAAIAIENSRLYEAVRQQAAVLEERVRDRTQELAAANQQLKAASRHKSEFLANMSHELRTPLNSILGFAQVLQEQTKEVLGAKQTRFLTNILTSGQHLLQLINDILDISKVEAGKFILQPEPIPVPATLEDILVIARGLANKKSQVIQADIPADLPALHADPVRFKQILFNLLSNAVKFTPKGGTITLTARQVDGESEQGRIGETETQPPGDGVPPRGSSPDALVCRERAYLEICVQDTGIGIKAEDLPRLFQEFVQLQASATKENEGTGLGLALTKRLVELHGGRIWAESSGEGSGSVFTVLLPLRGSSR
ncbi:MAG TPA: PAS domain S-box protein [Candidatus Methylomirabilis sp.]|nr:PAS domain S-box protein [Candidatus Methylomirabilis sp.]